MRREIQWLLGPAAAAIAYGSGLTGLGVLSLIFRDFSLKWEPVPPGVPARAALGVASGLILSAAGLLLLPPRSRPWGALIAAAFIGLWVVGLHLPLVIATPENALEWLGLAECLAMSMSGFVLFREPRLGAVASDRPARAAVRLLGASLIVFGASHFLFGKFTAAMVPPWLPMRLALAYLTGATHMACGMLLLTGQWRRAAAVAEAVMMSSFVLLVHIPRVALQPTSRSELTGLFVALTLTSGAWIIATSRVVGQTVHP